MGKKLPRSIRKYIRQEKARLRREVFDSEEQKDQIAALYTRFGQRNIAQRNKETKKLKDKNYPR